MAIDLTHKLAHGLPMALGWREEGQTFASLLRRYRKVQGLTQEELAQEWDYSFETISAWEREKRFPARSEFPRLARLLGMDAEELTEMIVNRRAGQVSKDEQRSRQVSVSRMPEVAVPFEQGRLFWTLHLGLEHGRLQCLITCPLASGETWEVPLDSVADAGAIRQLHQMVHEHVSHKASGPTAGTDG